MFIVRPITVQMMMICDDEALDPLSILTCKVAPFSNVVQFQGLIHKTGRLLPKDNRCKLRYEDAIQWLEKLSDNKF